MNINIEKIHPSSSLQELGKGRRMEWSHLRLQRSSEGVLPRLMGAHGQRLALRGVLPWWKCPGSGALMLPVTGWEQKGQGCSCECCSGNCSGDNWMLPAASSLGARGVLRGLEWLFLTQGQLLPSGCTAGPRHSRLY